MVKIEVYHDGRFWCARGIGVDIFTQGDTLDALMESIREAVAVHFGDAQDARQVLILSELTVSHAKAPAG